MTAGALQLMTFWHLDTRRHPNLKRPCMISLGVMKVVTA